MSPPSPSTTEKCLEQRIFTAYLYRSRCCMLIAAIIKELTVNHLVTSLHVDRLAISKLSAVRIYIVYSDGGCQYYYCIASLCHAMVLTHYTAATSINMRATSRAHVQEPNNKCPTVRQPAATTADKIPGTVSMYPYIHRHSS